jgi:hypothetical protein
LIKRAGDALRRLEEIGLKAGKGFAISMVKYHLGALALTLRPKNRAQPINILAFGSGRDEHFTIKAMAEILKQLQRVIKEVAKLNRTPLVALLRRTGTISFESALSGPGLDEDESIAPLLGLHPQPPDDLYLARLVRDLKLVARAARDYSKKSQALVDVHLWRLCAYIFETTGNWNDQIVVDLLLPLRALHCESPESLRQWRTRSGLKKQVTRKLPKQPL